MKKVLRTILIIVTNVLAIPLQLILLMIYWLTNRTEEEEMAVREYFEEVYDGAKHWINTGRFDVPED